MPVHLFVGRATTGSGLSMLFKLQAARAKGGGDAATAAVFASLG
jgi:hypothetical protein